MEDDEINVESVFESIKIMNEPRIEDDKISSSSEDGKKKKEFFQRITELDYNKAQENSIMHTLRIPNLTNRDEPLFELVDSSDIDEEEVQAHQEEEDVLKTLSKQDQWL